MNDIVVGELEKAAPIAVNVDLVNRYINSFLPGKLHQNEIMQFCELACAFNLNPFKREIYCVAYGAGESRKLSLITGFEVYLKRANVSGLLDGWSVKTDGSLSNNDLKAIIEIHRKDFSHAFHHEVCFNEYKQNTKIWREKPITMIKKVAMAQGFRLCFPTELGGMPYTQDEMPKGDMIKPNEDLNVVDVQYSDAVKNSSSYDKLMCLLAEYKGDQTGLAQKWLDAANVEHLCDLTEDQINKCIKYLESK